MFMDSTVTMASFDILTATFPVFVSQSLGMKELLMFSICLYVLEDYFIKLQNRAYLYSNSYAIHKPT